MSLQLLYKNVSLTSLGATHSDSFAYPLTHASADVTGNGSINVGAVTQLFRSHPSLVTLSYMQGNTGMAGKRTETPVQRTIGDLTSSACSAPSLVARYAHSAQTSRTNCWCGAPVRRAAAWRWAWARAARRSWCRRHSRQRCPACRGAFLLTVFCTTHAPVLHWLMRPQEQQQQPDGRGAADGGGDGVGRGGAGERGQRHRGVHA